MSVFAGLGGRFFRSEKKVRSSLILCVYIKNVWKLISFLEAHGLILKYIITNKLLNCKKQNLSWEANNLPASQKIPRI
jgi:hypothetical protein